MFHAHLMHTELVGGDVRDEVMLPPWIMHEAREAWMRVARDDMIMSRDHAEVVSILNALGVAHEVEHLTDDGYFSVDVYLPDANIALEIDGPSHFISISDGGEGRGSLGDGRAWQTLPAASPIRGPGRMLGALSYTRNLLSLRRIIDPRFESSFL